MSKKTRTLTIIFQILTLISIVVVLVSTLIKATILNGNQYIDTIIAEGLDEEVDNAVENCFSSNQSLIAFDQESLEKSIDKETVRSNAHDYVYNAVVSILYGGAIEETHIDYSALAEELEKQFDGFEEDYNYETTAETRSNIENSYVENLNNVSNFLPTAVSDFLESFPGVSHYLDIPGSMFLPSCCLWLCSAFVTVMLNRENIARGVYKAMFATWIGVTLYCIPALIFSTYNVAEKLNLGEGTTTVFAKGFVKTISNGLLISSVIAFAVSTVAVVVSIIWYSKVQTKRHKKLR